ncbi:hypothetical protein [Carboxydothermus pertinax]|nr:hypothetical protein [Carboxydothermus pertinax]
MKESPKLNESELFHLLMNNPDLFQDILAAYDIRVRFAQLEPEVNGLLKM